MEATKRDIGAGLITVSKTNPRTSFDGARMKELQESIKAKGIVQPLTVRPDGNGKWELVAGERRLCAAKALGMPTVPAYVVEMTNEEAAEFQLLEFVQSEGITPLEEADAYNRYVKTKKGTVDIGEIAAKFGKTRRYIAERVQLNKLTKEFKDLLAKGKMTLSAALQIAKLHPDAQQQLFATTKRRRYLLEEDRADDLKEEIEQDYLLKLADALFDQADEKIFPKAGACLNCPKRSDVNQDLFGNTTKSVLCLDAVCFHKKSATFIEDKQREFEDKGLQLVRITADSYPESALKAIGTDKYHVVPKAAAHKKFGIYVEASYRSKLGAIVPIRLYSDDRKDRAEKGVQRELSASEKATRWKRRIEIFEQKINQAGRLKMVEAICKTIPSGHPNPSNEDLSALGKLLFSYEGHRINLERVCKVSGIGEIKSDYFDEDKVLKKYLASANRPMLIRFLIAAICDQDHVDDPSFGDSGQDHIDDFAKRYKVDVKKIRKAVAEEMEPKRPKKPIPEKKPKKKTRAKKSGNEKAAKK